ncbi:uncharacterized protein [Diabrotica undecimpunctata]|uniref:uncharacterized protein n=1 Tax=Diabrotica undecimpunctata TaxID=50387 RepID=UPI003B641C20
MGKHGLGMMNENGERFTNFCSSHNLVIGGTIFPHKNIHKVTWTAPGHTRENQIDHIAISKRWRSSLFDVRNKRGADIASDHHLVIGTIKIKMAKNKTTRNTKRPTYNLDKLKTVPGRHMFREKLQLKTREREINSWEDFADVLTEIAEDKLGKKEKDRKEWISDETWNLIEERKQRKKDILQARTVERKAHRQQEYQTINKSVKRKARRDKRRWAEQLAKQAEIAAQHNRTRELYQITRRLTQNGSNCSNIVRSKTGELLTTTDDQVERWKEHFQEILGIPRDNADEIIENPQNIDLHISWEKANNGTKIHSNVIFSVTFRAFSKG